MRVYINKEAFELIEASGSKGVTPEYLSKHLGIRESSARSWLSKWTKKGYLTHVEGSRADKQGRDKSVRVQGAYRIDDTCKWWGEKVFESETHPG